MRLKSVEIIGFKSFADKVKLEFHPGITGIVGPNGCGKSNIADAFRWVLGEQSAKSMRGSKMPDVIFAGTTTRKPLNFAEVTITLTEIEGYLPIDYEEISITRRLHRSGESEYFINRHLVRLKDVQSLFLDSGMGKDAYSIFEQGKIEQVINFNSLERRYIFEEAAGILRFLQRKREALKKLEQSDLNLSRVKDIHLEVEKQIIILEEQAEKARVYKQNKSKLETLEKGLFLAKWDFLDKKQTFESKKKGDATNHIAQCHHDIEKFNLQYQQAKAFYAEGEKVLKARNEQVYKTRSEKEIQSREKQTTLESIKDAVSKEKRWQQELDLMLDKRKKRQLEQQQAQKTQKECEGVLHAQEVTLGSLRTKKQTLENEVIRLREQQKKAQQELLNLTQEAGKIESDYRQCQFRHESSLEKKKQLTDKQERLKSQKEELSKQVEEKHQFVKELSSAIDEQKLQLAVLEKEQQALLESMANTQKILDRVNKELAELKARQKVLLKLREEMEGFSAGTKKLVLESANPASPLYNRIRGLYEYIQPEKGFEKAVAAAMKPYSQTLVVEKEEDFNAVVLFANQQKLKDYSLFCLQEGREEDCEIEASSLVKQAGGNAVSHHFFKKVHLSSDLKSALQVVDGVAGAEVWLEEEILVDHRKVVFFAAQSEKNIFMREAELKTLEKKIAEVEAEKGELEKNYREGDVRKNKLQTERVDLDKTIRKNEMKLVETNFSFQRAKGDQEKITVEMGRNEEELNRVEATFNSLVSSLEELKEKNQAAKAHISEVGKKANDLNMELAKQETVFKQEQVILQEKENAYHNVSDEHRKALHSLHVLEVRDLESLQQEKRLEEEIKGSKVLQNEYKIKSDEFERSLVSIETILTELTKGVKEFEEEMVRRRDGIETLNTQINQKQQALKKLENELYQAETHSQQIDQTKQQLENDLQERYHQTIEEGRGLGWGLEQSVEQLEKQMKQVRHEIESAGDINMTSIEEYDKHKTRYEFLNQQVDDLNLSKQELVQIIAQLDSESRKIFQDTFEKVRENFKKNFKILFNGGEADLQFTETADVLEAGIDIVAKPPGKQMRSISLLSGGEKCLTAMALLFAIFEVKPSPYCILDEIDAPLDDTNIERFVNVVQQFIDRCQFIIITHNKRTMSIADRLYGVSMEEKGISKLLTLEFAAI